VASIQPGPTWFQGIWLAASSTPRPGSAASAVDDAVAVDVPGVAEPTVPLGAPEHAASAAAEITASPPKNARVDLGRLMVSCGCEVVVT
jgi:hypothetical protein